MTTFPLRIISPAAEVFHGQAALVEAPGEEGDFGVLPNHSAFFSMIRPGIITVQAEIGSKRFFVASGYADVSPEGVTVLAERAVDIDTLDNADIRRQLELAEAALAVAETDAERAKAEKTLATLRMLADISK